MLAANSKIQQALKMVVSSPGDQLLRFAYVRALHRAGIHEQAEFIEKQLDEKDFDGLPNGKNPYPEWTGFDSIELPPTLQWEFRRGFVELLRCTAKDFLKVGEELSTRAPIRHLNITELATEDLPQLLRNPVFSNQFSLDFDYCKLDDDALKEFALTPFPKLVWLSLAYNPITLTGIDHLAKATAEGKFPNLKFVSLIGCHEDPREQLFYDQGAYVDNFFPPAGQAMLDRYASLLHSIPWLFLTRDGVPCESSRYVLSENPSLGPNVPPARRLFKKPASPGAAAKDIS